MSPQSLAYLLLPIALCAGQPLLAQSSCSSPSPDCVAVGEWDLRVSVGIGERSNPVADSRDIPLVVLPQLSYYGKRFFLDNLELGFTLHEGRRHTLNLIATPGYDRVFFVRGDLQNVFVAGVEGAVAPSVPPNPQDPPPETLEPKEVPVRPRRTTYFIGPEWLFDVGPAAAQLSALYEATGRHKGVEVRAALALPLLQAKSSIVATAGFTWKSAAVVDYYYGLGEVYDASSAFNPFVRLGFSRPLSERWSVTAFVHYERLGTGIADSPIVVEGAVTTAFAGFSFKVF